MRDLTTRLYSQTLNTVYEPNSGSVFDVSHWNRKLFRNIKPEANAAMLISVVAPHHWAPPI